MDRWDAVVVGAGLGGLTTAAYLATNGLRTLVLEQGKVVGGSSQVFRRRGRYEFDVGVHYIGECHPGGSMWTILRGVGLEKSIDFAQLDPDGYSTLVFPDLTFRVPRGWDAYLERLLETFPHEERGIRRCIFVLRRVAEEMNGDFPVGAREVAAFVRRAPLTVAIGARSLDWLYRRCGLSQPARAVLSGESGAYAAPASRVPITLHAPFLHHYLQAGAFYPRGGGQVIAARLVEVVEAYGGEVRTDTAVDRILVEGGRATGVRLTDGAVHEAAVVVSNADLKRTLLGLVGREHLRGRTVRRAVRSRMALPIFTAYLGLDVDIATRLPNSNLWCYPHTDIEAAYQDCYAGRLPQELPVLVTSSSVKDPANPRTAPPGHSTVELMAVVPPDAAFWSVTNGRGRLDYRSMDEYQSRKDEVMEALIASADSVLPGLSQHIVLREASTPITHERFTGATGGTGYGLELATDQVGLQRPGPTTEIRGLFLVGASTRWCHGVMGAMNGGVGTASAVLGRDLRQELKRGRRYADPVVASGLIEDAPRWDPLVVSRGKRRRPASKDLRGFDEDHQLLRRSPP